MDWAAHSPRHSSRNRLIIAARLRGATYAEAGAIGGVSANRAQQICERAKRVIAREAAHPQAMEKKEVTQRCDACGVEYNASPQNHGDEHRCGPKEWAAYQNCMLKMILAAVSASPLTEADILTAQKLFKESPCQT